MGFFLLEDGGHLTLESGAGDMLLESGINPVPPAPPAPTPEASLTAGNFTQAGAIIAEQFYSAPYSPAPYRTTHEAAGLFGVAVGMFASGELERGASAQGMLGIGLRAEASVMRSASAQLVVRAGLRAEGSIKPRGDDAEIALIISLLDRE